MELTQTNTFVRDPTVRRMIHTLHPRTSKPPARDEELVQLEAALGEPIPSQLRSLLMTANGAWIPDVAIPTESCPEVPGGGIGGEQFHSTAEIIETRGVYSGRVSADLLAFGNDDFGNALCIGLHGLRRDKIYIWDHEDDVAGGLAMGMDVDPEGVHQNEYFVADSLTEFIFLYRDTDHECA